MGAKEGLKKLEQQIEKKRKDIEKTSNQIKTLEDKKVSYEEELEKMELLYYKETLRLNNMTFDDFKELLSSKE